MALLSVGVVFAAVSGVTINSESSETYSQSPATTTAQGGNVTQLDLTQNIQSGYWQAFYGNISGNLALRDANGVAVYDWGTSQFNGYIFFARGTVTWGSLVAPTETDIENEDSTLGLTGKTDSVNNTKTVGSTKTINIGGGDIGTTYYINMTSGDGWVEPLYTDGTNIVYTGYINSTGKNAYNGKKVNFQVMVPTDGSKMTYYIYAYLTE